MYCPRCGQQQATEDVRFCSRCGFALAELPGLLARGGAPEGPQSPQKTEELPRRKGLKQGGKIFLAVLLLVIFLAIVEVDEDTVAPIAVLGFMAAFLRALYALAFQRGPRGRLVPDGLGRLWRRLRGVRLDTLPPADANPVALPRARFDTMGIVAEPPSVTEHTTRHLEQERPRVPEREP